ncbi:MAG: Ig-like domain repeat protein, partial [Actinobacteria bacterium]|nr:Ig-like domain repeat protein [Actinomycetota bacterium]
VYPVSGAPAPVGTTTLPVVTGQSGDQTIGTTAADLPQTSTTAGYVNTYELRLKTSAPGKSATVGYDYADITINTSAGTWSVAYTPDPPAGTTATTTTIDPSTPTTVGAGSNVTLAADVTSTSGTPSDGTVQFFNGSNAIGSAVNVGAGGIATTTTSFASPGTEQITAKYTPGAFSSFAASPASTAYPITVTAVPTPTVTLGITGGYQTSGSTDVVLTATVTPAAAASDGTVSFTDAGTTIPGTVTSSANTFTLALPTGFSAGSHTVVAKFTSTVPSAYQSAQSPSQSFITQVPVAGACAQPGAVCTDQQTIEATVPVGTLVINTPYSAQNPLNLGTLALSADSKVFSASASFNNIVVTDTRAGNLPWTVSALASPLTDGGTNPNSSINPENLGLTTIQATPGTGFTGTITPTDNAAANAVAPDDAGSLGLGGTTAHTVAKADHGLGTVTMKGTLALNAPSSTEPGLFTGTITFTVG